MTVGTLLYDALVADGSIAALVDDRVYPIQLPQDPTLEALTYQRISNTEQRGTTELRETRYQINCWAERYQESQDLATVVKSAMEEWSIPSKTPLPEKEQPSNEGL